jgi:PAS domain S-box-containing protein
MAGPGATPDVPPPRSAAVLDHDARVGSDQLLALIDNTSAIIYMRDFDGHYMLVNREYEKLFGVRREDIIGRTDHDLFPGEVADAFRSNDLQALARGIPIQVEETAPGLDGLHTYVTVKFPLLDATGKAYAVCGISTDITDRKRAENLVATMNTELEQRVQARTAELEASTQELSAFAYSVSHDLRAPLRSLHGFSQVLLDDYAGSLDETGVAHLRRLQANANRMSEIIDDLLRLSRTTQAELIPGPIDLGALARSIHEELQIAEPERAVTFFADGLLLTVGDVRLITLALQNLMTNAWKFTGGVETATITVGSLQNETVPVYFVRDNGAGFDPRYSAKLFEPFQRLHSTDDFEGNGIGLAIVQRVIRRHGGDIWAESTPGQGATFYFTMNADVDSAQAGDSDE